MSLKDAVSLPRTSTGPIGSLATLLERLAGRLLLRLTARLEHGALIVEFPSGTRFHSMEADTVPQYLVKLHRWRAIARLLVGGDIGFAKGYMQGDWSTPDIARLLEFFAHNEVNLEAAWRGLTFSRWSNRVRHGARVNTRRGSRRNVEAHYDLGNDFYAAWLDRGMNYSSALYTGRGQTLEEAQAEKLDRVISLLDPRPGARVLEIGCGWGAFAERLLERKDCCITGITLSREQYAFAKHRLIAVGDRARILLKDYRDVKGRFDSIVSIEMLEAVGESYWPVFFKKLHSLLAPGGKAVLQVITIDESRFQAYRRRPDFIQRFIFPGGMLPTRTIIAQQVAGAGLALTSCQLFGESYARTLSEWRSRYVRSAPPSGAKHPQSACFSRMWEYYLAYCEAGFRAGVLEVGLYQITHRT